MTADKWDAFQEMTLWWVCRWWWRSDTVASPLTSCSFSLLARSPAGSVRLSGARRRFKMLSSSLARSSSSFSSCWASEATFGSSAPDGNAAGGGAMSIVTQSDGWLDDQMSDFSVASNLAGEVLFWTHRHRPDCCSLEFSALRFFRDASRAALLFLMSASSVPSLIVFEMDKQNLIQRLCFLAFKHCAFHPVQ